MMIKQNMVLVESGEWRVGRFVVGVGGPDGVTWSFEVACSILNMQFRREP